jgi:hypothetical protein
LISLGGAGGSAGSSASGGSSATAGAGGIAPSCQLEQYLPSFAAVADPLDLMNPPGEEMWRTASTLQGLINRTQPRIYIRLSPDEDNEDWLSTLNVATNPNNDVFDLIGKYRDEIAGLVIFDPNSARLRPLDAIAGLKRDPDLRDIRTLGYVSHVDTATIDAARAAGIDQVMARSAFVNQLGEILTTA